jgi:hypothetical protein
MIHYTLVGITKQALYQRLSEKRQKKTPIIADWSLDTFGEKCIRLEFDARFANPGQFIKLQCRKGATC